MRKELHQPITLNDILHAASRHKLFIAIVIAAALIPAIIYNQRATPHYTATSTIIFEDYGIKDEVVPGSRSLQAMENFVPNRMEEMGKMPFAREIYRLLTPAEIALFPGAKATSDSSARARSIINQIRLGLIPRQIKKTDVVELSFSARSPHLTQRVPNLAARVLQNWITYLHHRESSDAKNFLDVQTEIAREDLARAERARQAFKDSKHIYSIEEESRAILRRKAEMETQLRTVQTDIEAAKIQLSALRQNLGKSRQALSKSILGITSPLVKTLKEQLVALETQHLNLLARGYPPTHPKLREIELASLRTRSQAAAKVREIVAENGISEVVDPVPQIQQILSKSIDLDVKLGALNARRADLQARIAEAAATLQSYPSHEARLGRLEREVELAGQRYRDLYAEQKKAVLRQGLEFGNTRVIQEAELPRTPSHPRKLLNVFVALSAGLLLGVFVVSVRELSQDAPRSQQDVEAALGLPVLALIPKVRHGQARVLGLGQNPSKSRPLLHDAFSTLLNALRLEEGRATTVLVTSSIPGEGKSTIAANLAIMAAKQGKKTILVEGDLRRPAVHTLFGLPAGAGLTDLLKTEQATATVQSRIRSVVDDNFLNNGDCAEGTAVLSGIFAITQPTVYPYLRVITRGRRAQDPAMAWSSRLPEDLLAVLKEKTDLIIMDAPPVIGMPDACILAPHFDKTVFCLASGKVEKAIVTDARAKLADRGANLAGIVLNRVPPAEIFGSDKYYKYYAKYYNGASGNIA